MRTYIERHANVEVIPTGSLTLDNALGIGGYPKGHIIEIFGWDSTGKTTLALHAIAECQKQGGTAVFVDVEQTFDCNYAQKLGVNINELCLFQPEDAEHALHLTVKLMRLSVVDLIVVDSVTALVSLFEKQDPMGKKSSFPQTLLVNYAVNRIIQCIGTGVCIFIDQMRMKPDKETGFYRETPTGGYALENLSTIRLNIRRFDTIKEGDVAVGNQVSVEVVKNNMDVPYRKAAFEIIFGKGISRIGEIIDLGLNTGIIKKIGSWLTYNDYRLGQSRYDVKKELKRNPELAAEIEAKIADEFRKRMGVTYPT